MGAETKTRYPISSEREFGCDRGHTRTRCQHRGHQGWHVKQNAVNRRLLILPLVIALGGCEHLRELEPDELRSVALGTAGERRNESPGVAVATVITRSSEAEIVVERAGVAALADNRALSPDTAFMWFSITKLFTATAIMQLNERGLLDIDAPVRDLLGDEFAIADHRYRPVTARDLLSHSSGLGNPSVWKRAHPAGTTRASVADLLAQLSSDHGPRLRYPPGQGQRYSNLGYLVLGRMIEVADGRDYETYVREEILDVLDMQRTGFHWEPLLDDAAIGHSRKGWFYTTLAKRVADPAVFDEPIPGWETTVPFEVEGTPYGGLIGSAEDLARFLAAHLQQGAWEGRRILSPASVAAMQTVQRDHRGQPLDFGLGWHTQVIDGERYFNHMGKGGGFRPEVRLWPSRRYGVVILTNRTRYDPRPLSRTVPPLEQPDRTESPRRETVVE
ncbi:MAG: serine hydrolase domain-containing protein [Enhygromyxa sp.]